MSAQAVYRRGREALADLFAAIRVNPQYGVNVVLVSALVWQLLNVASPQALQRRSAGGARQSTSAASARPAISVNLDFIRAAHLFGAADATAGDGANVQSTDLPLLLVGTVASNDAMRGLAVVREGQRARLYAIGDSLPGGARLREVQSRVVLIERGGMIEKLLFPHARGDALAGLIRPPPSVAIGLDAEAPAEAALAAATRLFVRRPGSAPVEDYYAEQQAAANN